VRARLSTNAAGWRTLTANQRAGWTDLGISINRSDALGQSYDLTGFLCYCMVNNNRSAAGDALLADAPGVITPVNILTAILTLTAAAFSIAYTATPLAAATRLFTYVSPQRSPGINFNGDFRLLAVSAAAAASPANVFAAYSAKFGVPVVGNKIFVAMRAYNGGFLSGAFTTNQVVA